MIDECCKFISQFEGFSAIPYQNPGDRPTIGYGNTFWEDGRAVTLDDSPIDEPRAQQLLAHFVSRCISDVEDLVRVPTTDNQMIALVDFEYNTGALNHSTLLAKLNSTDYEGAGKEFPKWDHENGKVIPGLLTRRLAEQKLFLEDV